MPLHLLDNLSNLTDPASARSVLGLGVENSPQFASLTASGMVTSPEYSVTGTDGDISITKSVTTWEFGTNTFSVSAQATTPRGIDFNNTGTRVLVLNSTTGAIGVYQYDLSPSSPWDITTAVYSSVSKSLTGVPLGIKFSTDGLYMFISNDTGDKVDRYTLVNPWDLSTVSVNPDQTYTLTNVTNGVSTLTIPRGIDFSPDGTKMYVTDDNQNSVYQFNLVNPWSVNTAAYSGNSINFNVAPVSDIGPQHAVISSDGTRLIMVGQTNDLISEYTLPTPFSLAGAFLHGWMRVSTTDSSTFNPLPVVAVTEGQPTGLYYNDELNKFFFIGIDARHIQEVIVNPQILLTGQRPLIQGTGSTSGYGAGYVRMTSLRITDPTNTDVNTSGRVGALTVAGGVGVRGNINVGGTVKGFTVLADATGSVSFQARSIITSPADSIIRLTNSTSNGFDRLQLGGSTDAFPSIARNGSGIDIKFASLTGDLTDLRARNITSTSYSFSGYPTMNLYANSNSVFIQCGTGTVRFFNGSIRASQLNNIGFSGNVTGGMGNDATINWVSLGVLGIGAGEGAGRTDGSLRLTNLSAVNITASGTLAGLNLVTGGAPISATSSITLALTDLGRVIRYSGVAAISATVPDQSTVAWPDGSLIYLRRNAGAGTITIQGSGGTIINDNISTSVPAGSMMAIRRVTTNEWDFI